MDTDVLENRTKEDDVDTEFFQGEKRKLIQPTALNDPKLSQLKEALVDWINSTLKVEHIVVQSLEEDLYDGLVLHHLLSRFAGVSLPLEEITLTSRAQRRKLDVVLAELDERLPDSSRSGWSAELIHKKDLLATIHLLVAMVRCFQPELDLPPNVKVEVLIVEVGKGGIKSEVQMEVLTEGSGDAGPVSLGISEGEDPIEQLLKLEAHKVNTVKKAILHFVNQTMSTMGLHVADLDKQFADGVILLLLIGQLEGFFIPLSDFNLTPVNQVEMVLTHASLFSHIITLKLLCCALVRISSSTTHGHCTDFQIVVCSNICFQIVLRPLDVDQTGGVANLYVIICHIDVTIWTSYGGLGHELNQPT